MCRDTLCINICPAWNGRYWGCPINDLGQAWNKYGMLLYTLEGNPEESWLSSFYFVFTGFHFSTVAKSEGFHCRKSFFLLPYHVSITPRHLFNWKAHYFKNADLEPPDLTWKELCSLAQGGSRAGKRVYSEGFFWLDRGRCWMNTIDIMKHSVSDANLQDLAVSN